MIFSFLDQNHPKEGRQKSRVGGKLASFTDVCELQRQLKAQGVEFVTEADETSTGPASFAVMDPDGNPILVDQHV